ncbi:redoxin family protein [Armatimonas rosea]|uniref:Outer membrane lipoprotein-sorting protein/peroxiredoxin n=1 Tax=Armatimonas rosea TaxID=685828 RepID=A0A7W9SN74_ARMRO|nr:redoxin family protein [Armatimonas rosea]MBB6049737.1 outer membrane lipoprotein-sorting protein/peroxiredoxin [Armatimonas rosea]
MLLPLLAAPALLATAPTFADDKAAALLAEVAARGSSLKSFSAEVTMTMTGPQSQKMSGKLLLQPPGFGRVEFTPDKGEKILMILDGKSTYSITGKKFTKTPVDMDGIWPFLKGVPGADPKKFTSVGTEKIEETTFDVLELKEASQTLRVYISPEKIIQRFRVTVGDGTQGGQELVISHVQLDTELAAENFTLPTGLEEAKAPGAEGLDALNAKLLKVGTTAPAFNLGTPTGGKLSLAQALKGKKAVLVNFWFFNCGPCRAEHPELQKLYTSLKAKGFGLVAVDQGDDSKTITDYMKKAGLTFPAVKGVPGTFTAYGVQAFPTNYLVGANGKILYRSVGFDEAGLKAALAKAGLK